MCLVSKLTWLSPSSRTKHSSVASSWENLALGFNWRGKVSNVVKLTRVHQVDKCTVLLGQDTEELHFLGRTLAEKIETTKPIIFAVGVKNLTVPLALELVKFVTENL